MLDSLRIKAMKCDTMMANEDRKRKGKEGEDVEDVEDDDVEGDDVEGDDVECDDDQEEGREEDEATRNQQIIMTLRPRAKGTFYKSIVNDLKCWKRPPHDHCDRCTDYHVSN